MWTIKIYISKILSILFPPRCYICRKEGKTICDECINKIPKSIDIQSPYITSIYSFKDKNLKNIIHAIKYYHRKDLIRPLMEEVAKILLNEKYKEQELNELNLATPYTLNPTRWILVPIPMPKIRKYMRGYNQAELIANEMSEILSVPTNTDILIRAYNPKRQVKSINRSERLKNQHNSFKIIGNVSNLNIILIDDITTTGATLNEARSILLKAGAKNVKAVTVAH